MSEVLVLAHFCDSHGPQPLITTKVKRGSEEAQTSRYKKQTQQQSPRRGRRRRLFSENEGSFNGNAATENCEGCKWLAEKKHILSIDEKHNTEIESTRIPDNQELHILVRQACVRAMSCEVCQGQEGCVMFGNSEQGYCLSFLFYLQDRSTRGQKSYYACLMLSADRLQLVHNYTFIKRHFAFLAMQLKNFTTAEHEVLSRSSGEEFVSTSEALRSSSDSNQESASLGKITGLGDRIPLFVHAHFAFLLRALRMRYCERQIEGPSMLASSMSQKRSLTFEDKSDLEKTTNGLKNASRTEQRVRSNSESEVSKFVQQGGSIAIACLEHHDPDLHQGSRVTATPVSIPQKKPLNHTLGSDNAERLSASLSGRLSTSLTVGGSLGSYMRKPVKTNYENKLQSPVGPPLFSSLRDVARATRQSPEHFELLIYNIVIGNQCVVRSPWATWTNSLLKSLSCLLPPQCVSMELDQENYLDSYKANFLGLRDGVAVPDYVPCASYILVELGSEQNNSITMNIFTDLIGNSENPPKRCEFVKEITDRFYAGPNLVEAADEVWMEFYRESWMHKAKAYFMISKRMVGGGDKMGMLDMLLRRMRLSRADIPVLLMYGTALSRSHRIKLLGQQRVILVS
eukprot:m.43433 g.43433  ORF g.43433 m.43433 type:complete len:627 (+) comp9976_c0_seq2:379-2259(+)